MTTDYDNDRLDIVKAVIVIVTGHSWKFIALSSMPLCLLWLCAR